jgi:type II pantothenate kinase
VKIMATGGGAHLFYEKLSEDLGVEVRKEEEMECLIAGLKFSMQIPHEVFWYSDQLVHSISHPIHKCSLQHDHETEDHPAHSAIPPPMSPSDLPRPSPNPPQYSLVYDEHPTPQFPCMLVNIGSGVSIIKVDADGQYERISGTSLGGGTLWGLLSLLTGADSFDGAFSSYTIRMCFDTDLIISSQKCSHYQKEAIIPM